MAKHNWTGSRTDLVLLCQWWARPDVELPSLPPGPAAVAGTNGHSAIERAHDPALDDSGFAVLWGCDAQGAVDVRYALLDGIRTILDNTFGVSTTTQGEHEVAFAYSPESGGARLLPKREGHRDYSDCAHYEVGLTVDYVARRASKGLVVDWKFGEQRGLHHPSEAGQLLLGALCLASVYELDSVTVAYAFPDTDGSMRVVSADVDTFDLADFEERLRVAWAAIHDNPQPQPGPHCRDCWCPARTICPAAQQASADVYALAPVEHRLPVVVSEQAITSPEHALALHTSIHLAEQFAEAQLRAARAALKAWLEHNGPVDVGDGSRLAVVQKEGRETLALDERGAEILKEALGEASSVAMKTTIEATKTSVEEATKRLAKGKERTALARRVLDELRGAGQVRKGAEYSVVDIVKDKKRKAAAE